MKKVIPLLSVLLCVLAFSACTDISAASSDVSAQGSSEPSSVLKPAESAPTQSDSSAGSAPDVSSTAMPSSASSEPPVQLCFYDSFRDIPFVSLDYEMGVDGLLYKGGLEKNGELWCAAPGLMEFGERCFTDGTRLWIQVYQYPRDDFDWWHICFDHFNCDYGWTNITETVGDPPYAHTQVTYPLKNKIFTHAEGYTIYTDDGFSYTVESCPLANNQVP